MLNCETLHTILKNGKRFDVNTKENELLTNGIYILFERGETGHNGDRIVRIGTHTGDNQFHSRIRQHFINEKKDRSIFRKNIGRAMLNKENDPYLSIWNYDLTSKINKEKYIHLIDKLKEQKLEAKISKYLQENFYFVAFSINSKELRLELERKLIGTVSNCQICKPSTNWLGNFSPINKIRNSGLWLVQGLFSGGLNTDNLKLIDELLIK